MLQTEAESKMTFKGIDLMKFVCIFFVICIHTDPFLNFNTDIAFILKNILSRVAVPFYFMAAGFFFTRKIISINDEKLNKKYFIKYITKVLIVYLLWSLIFLPYDMYHLLKESSNTLTVIGLYIKDLIFNCSHWHLWFLPALILAIAILYYFLKKKKILTLLVISIVLYFIGLFGDSYYGIIKGTVFYPIMNTYLSIFNFTRNGLFFGIVFVTLGAYISQNHKAMPKAKNIILIIIGYGLLAAEAFILRENNIPRLYSYNMFITLIPLAYYIFVFFLNINLKISDGFAKRLRGYSMGAYCSHAVFLILIVELFKVLQFQLNNSLYFLLVTGLSLVLVYALKYSRLKILRKLVL